MIPGTTENVKLLCSGNGAWNQKAGRCDPKVSNLCFKITLSAGESMVMPAGWIHSVRTTQNSFAVGINFLTSFELRKYSLSKLFDII